MKKIIMTGASGNIGLSLLRSIKVNNYKIHAIIRDINKIDSSLLHNENIKFHIINDLVTSPIDDLRSIMKGANILIHLAAPIHESTPVESSATFKIANNIAQAAAHEKIPYILNVSSIAARIAEENDMMARPYGYRKLKAEQCFISLDNTKVIHLRPPAVYGQGMRGTFSLLAKLIGKSLPLPLGLATAPRDYISVNNLTDLIWCIVSKDKWPVSPNVYEPCDGRSLSTRELVKEIANIMGKPAILIPVPAIILRILGKLTNKQDLIEGAIGPIAAKGNEELAKNFGWQVIETIPKSLYYLEIESLNHN